MKKNCILPLALNYSRADFQNKNRVLQIHRKNQHILTYISCWKFFFLLFRKKKSIIFFNAKQTSYDTQNRHMPLHASPVVFHISAADGSKPVDCLQELVNTNNVKCRRESTNIAGCPAAKHAVDFRHKYSGSTEWLNHWGQVSQTPSAASQV